MRVMNALLVPSDQTTKPPSTQASTQAPDVHLGRIASCFVGLEAAKFDSGYDDFARYASSIIIGEDWTRDRLESGVILSEDDFAIYATLWLKLLDAPSSVSGLRQHTDLNLQNDLLRIARNGGTWASLAAAPPAQAR